MSIIEKLLNTDPSMNKEIIELRRDVHIEIDEMTSKEINKHARRLYNGHRYMLEDYVLDDIGYEEASKKLIDFFIKHKKDL